MSPTTIVGIFGQSNRLGQFGKSLDQKKITLLLCLLIGWCFLMFGILLYLRENIFGLFWEPVRDLGITVSFSDIHSIRRTEFRELFFLSMWLSSPVALYFACNLFVLPSMNSGPSRRLVKNGLFFLLILWVFLTAGACLGIYLFPQYINSAMKGHQEYSFVTWKPELSTMLQVFRKMIFTGIGICVSFPLGFIFSKLRLDGSFKRGFILIVFLLCGYYFFYEPEFWLGISGCSIIIFLTCYRITDSVGVIINNINKRRNVRAAERFGI